MAPEGSLGTVGTPSVCCHPVPHFQTQVAVHPPLPPTRPTGLLRALSKVPIVSLSSLKLSHCGLGLYSKCPAASPVPSPPLLLPSALFFELIYLFGHASQHMDLSSPTRDQTHAPAVQTQSLNHWSTRELPPPPAINSPPGHAISSPHSLPPADSSAPVSSPAPPLIDRCRLSVNAIPILCLLIPAFFKSCLLMSYYLWSRGPQICALKETFSNPTKC